MSFTKTSMSGAEVPPSNRCEEQVKHQIAITWSKSRCQRLRKDNKDISAVLQHQESSQQCGTSDALQ